MKRASLLGLSLLGLVGLVGQGGCVSQGKYDALHVAWSKCDGERNELRNQLSSANARLETLEAERTTLTADKEARIQSLLAEVQKAGDMVNRLRDDNAKLVAELTKIRPGDIHIHEGQPRLLPKVHEALKKFAQDHPGLIEYDEKNGLVRFSTDLLFDKGSFELKGDIAKQLGDFAEVINIPEAKENYDVLVVGHTDNLRVALPATKEKTPTNWHLSVFRAVSVVLALNHAKVDSHRLGAMGFGEERPRVANKPGGTKENRRVEVYLVPKNALTTTSMILKGEDIVAAMAD